MTQEQKDKIEFLRAKYGIWLEKKSAFIVFLLVCVFVISAIVYLVHETTTSNDTRHISISMAFVDSLSIQKAYKAEEIDSLISVVRNYENKLNERYQYMLDRHEDDERFKTWGALIVGVIVSVCSFWGYKSLKDVKMQAEQRAIMSTNEYLDRNLETIVKEQLKTALRGDNLKTVIVANVMDALNSDDNNIINTRIKAVMEEGEYSRYMDELIKEKVDEIINGMMFAQLSDTRNPEHNNEQINCELEL